MRKLFAFALASALSFTAQANEWRQFTSNDVRSRPGRRATVACDGKLV
jgi:hypothetical protein